MQLADLMATDVLSVSPDTTIADAARRMVEHETGAAVVIEDGDLVGVISRARSHARDPGRLRPREPVSERMAVT